MIGGHWREIDENGRVVPERFADDTPRGTFTGSAAEFMAAKRRGVVTPADADRGASRLDRSAGNLPIEAPRSPLMRETPADPVGTAPEPAHALPVSPKWAIFPAGWDEKAMH